MVFFLPNDSLTFGAGSGVKCRDGLAHFLSDAHFFCHSGYSFSKSAFGHHVVIESDGVYVCTAPPPPTSCSGPLEYTAFPSEWFRHTASAPSAVGPGPGT